MAAEVTKKLEVRKICHFLIQILRCATNAVLIIAPFLDSYSAVLRLTVLPRSRPFLNTFDTVTFITTL